MSININTNETETENVAEYYVMSNVSYSTDRVGTMTLAEAQAIADKKFANRYGIKHYEVLISWRGDGAHGDGTVRIVSRRRVGQAWAPYVD